MAQVTIYTTGMCGYCYRAKALLEAKGVDFTEIDVTFDPGKRAEMREKAGGRSTVPQIWIGEEHIGGSEELFDLEARGELDGKLKAIA